MRRIVTGNGRDGRSTVVHDGGPPTVFRFGTEGDPHAATPEQLGELPPSLAPETSAVAELWATDEVLDAAADATATGNWDVECPPGGTRCRLVRYGPGLSAPLHRTATLDYDVVLSGSVDLLLEDGTEVAMTAYDVVVIPGIVHGWRAGPAGCTMFIVMSGLAG
jgi:quercetin dioxygenase-like cupin family protein